MRRTADPTLQKAKFWYTEALKYPISQRDAQKRLVHLEESIKPVQQEESYKESLKKLEYLIIAEQARND
jgi:hypothetical protein